MFASFALPAVAAGGAVAAVALPVLIHLLSRQRFRVIEWAAMRFLLAAQKKHRRRIDHWLLLLLRVMALALPLAGMCAVAPWAESVWQSISPGAAESVSNAPRTHHIFVLDASLSLTARAGDETRFEKMIGLAEEALRNANPGDGFTLIVLAGQAQAIVPGPSTDTGKVLAELRTVKPTHGNADLVSGLTMVADTLNRSPRQYPRRQVTFFTDMQRTAWSPVMPSGDKPAPEAWKPIFAKSDVVCVDVGSGDTDNLAVTGVELDDPLPLVDAPVSVKVTVQNFGKTDKRQVRLELSLGRPASGEARLLPVEQRTIDALPAGEKVAITFALEGGARFRSPGVHLLRAKLVDGDELSADDVRTLAVEVREGLSCVLVNGKPAAEPLRRGTEYLFEALDPAGRRLAGNPARPKVVSLAEFSDPALSDLSAVDCVFLCDVPTFTPSQVARLEAVLSRGGGVVIGLGPNAAANAEVYNRMLFDNGKGMLPGKIVTVVDSASNPQGYRLVAEEDAFRLPPLDAFRDDNARAGLTGVPFQKYVLLDAPADGRGRRVLSFVSPKSGAKPAPAVIDLPRNRGRVVVYTSTFNADWTDWPVLPSYLPFVHELLRFAATSPDRHTVRVGEPIDDFLSPSFVGGTATVSGPDGISAKVPIAVGDDAGIVRFADTTLSGIYRVSTGGSPDHVFSVNVPETAPGGGSESDLRRIDVAELKTLSPGIQVVSKPDEVKIQSAEGSVVVTTPRPHGPTIARWLISLALFVLVFETWFAWRIGPARTTGIAEMDGGAERGRSYRRYLRSALGLLPLALVALVLFAVFHAQATGQLLGFLPEHWRLWVEAFVGVPAAAPGEGTRWRLESFPAFLKNALNDRRLVWGLAVAALLVVVFSYRYETRAVGRFRRIVVPLFLRIGVLLLAFFVLLPQLRLAFDREGFPDVAILLDTSASMATKDELNDPEVRRKADELKKAAGLTEAGRLRLAKAILLRKDADWLTRLLTERQVKLHVYSLADQARLVASMDEEGDLAGAKRAVEKLTADGGSSRLGDGISAVLKAFRGGSLAAVVAFTDGQVTAGDDLPQAGREAARANVPLYLVGLGDAVELPDLALSDLRADDTVMKNDTYVLDVRMTAKGPVPSGAVPVVLYERVDGRKIERARTSVRPDPSGKPVPVTMRYAPAEAGEKTLVVEVPGQPGETELSNNQIERVVVVTESRRLKVLLVDGLVRYEFRFVKVLLERETEAVRGNKSIDLHALLLDAHPDYASLDKSALRTFPTRSELFEYDVVILGDVDPNQFPRPAQTFKDLAEFVTRHGGGLLVVAGEHANPQKLFDTPLADVLPIVRNGAPKMTSEDTPIIEGYHPKLTQTGAMHPFFRFAADDAENARIWAGLKPMLWHATGYKRKLSAEVLAVHPDILGEGGEHFPLVLQQFVGLGRCVFLGFDETWRWRYRLDEERFNQFWIQMVRVLARNRVARAELRTDKQTAYRRDDPIKLTLRFPDDSPPPDEKAGVRLTAERSPPRNPDGTPGTGPTESQTIRMTKVDGSRATYSATLTRTPEGEYRFWLSEPAVTGTKPRAEARVLPPPGERERLEMNRVALTKAAAESRGKFYTLADVDSLIDDLPEAERVPLNQPCPPVPVWNHEATFGLLALLLAAEWILRRRERLV